MRIAHIKTALFALFLAAPVAVLLLSGAVDSYGREHAAFPGIGELLRGKKGRLDEFGTALLQRSSVTKRAIELQSWVSYHLIGFVDTPLVVSGEDGWLFFRPEFTGGRCLDEARAAAALRQLAVQIDMGRVAGIEVFFSISPDKSTIFPEMLNQRMRGYWRCREQNIATLRRLLKRWAPQIIDHAEPLLLEKAEHPERPLYFSGDTHWTSYGAALGLRQLLARVFPDASALPPQVAAMGSRKADLSKMLLLSLDVPLVKLDPVPEDKLVALNRDPVGYRTVIARDSFYGVIKPQLSAIFPSGQMLSLEDSEEQLGPATMAADRLIINTVERSLLSRAIKSKLRWNTPMMTAIIKRNAIAAKACGAFAAIGPMPRAETGVSVGIPAAEPTRLPCIRLTLAEPTGGLIEVLLPDPQNGAIEPGHGFKYELAPDEHVVSFILPDYVAGASIRVERGADQHPIALQPIEIGTVSRADIQPPNR